MRDRSNGLEWDTSRKEVLGNTTFEVLAATWRFGDFTGVLRTAFLVLDDTPR